MTSSDRPRTQLFRKCVLENKGFSGKKSSKWQFSDGLFPGKKKDPHLCGSDLLDAKFLRKCVKRYHGFVA